VVDGSFVKIFSAEHLETIIDAETSAFVNSLSKETSLSLQNDTFATENKNSERGSAATPLMSTNIKLGVTTETNMTYLMS